MNPQQLSDSELIITGEGRIYHLDLHPSEIADTVITVGDPGRVAVVSKYFDRIEVQRAHREFVTHTGYIGNKRLSVVSTGIGPDNIDIVLHELDALVNIDFPSRAVKDNLRSLNIIRMGTSGALQEDVKVDSMVVSSHAIGLDNLLHFYQLSNNQEEQFILNAFNKHVGIHEHITPYIVNGSVSLMNHFTDGYHHGITVTCPGFYGPQGRMLRLPLTMPDLLNGLSSFDYNNKLRIVNFEMETSAIYGLGRLMNHHCLSISVIVANRQRQAFSADAALSVEKMISRSLPVIAAL